MVRARMFKSGKGRAIRIPAEIACGVTDRELEIKRLGELITIVPAKRTLKETANTLRGMPKPVRN